MTPRELRAHIRPLPEYLPRTHAMEAAIGVGAGFGGAWYRSQKEHWLGWLAEYAGPGAYSRRETMSRSARLAYNRIQCAPMLFWLGEAACVHPDQLDHAHTAVISAPTNGSAQCAALRDCLPWADIEHDLISRDYSIAARLRIRLSTWATPKQNGG